eukprot:jgi/Tetstr1/447443/TSEL_003702.t1
MVHLLAEMSMETAVGIDSQQAWAKARRCVNERVVAAVEADDPVVLDRALKWKYLYSPAAIAHVPGATRAAAAVSLSVALLRIRRAAHDSPNFCAHGMKPAPRRFMPDVRRPSVGRTLTHLFAAPFVSTVDYTVVALAEDGELSQAAGRLS